MGLAYHGILGGSSIEYHLLGTTGAHKAAHRFLQY